MKFDITNPIYNDPDAARSHLEETLWPMGTDRSRKSARRAIASPRSGASIASDD